MAESYHARERARRLRRGDATPDPASPQVRTLIRGLMPRVLVTGASGFIAGHCVRELLEHGYDVRGTVRTRRPEHDALGIELVQADLLEPDGWAAAADGCDFALHTASPLPTGAPERDEDLIGPAVAGTRNVLTACRAAGVRRVVVTSSSAAVINVDRPPDHVYTEADFSDPERCSAYPRSKTLAERAAWDLADGMELAVVNPVLVAGPVINGRLNASLEPFRRMLTRAMPAIPRLGFTVVDVRDVAVGHRLAMEQPVAAGKRYLLASEFLWLREVAECLAAEFPDRRVPTRHLPYAALWLAARFDKPLRSVLSDVGVRRNLSSERAQHELGWEPRGALESVLDTAHSLIDARLV